MFPLAADFLATGNLRFNASEPLGHLLFGLTWEGGLSGFPGSGGGQGRLGKVFGKFRVEAFESK